MFSSLGSFSIFFFSCLTLIVLCIWYEDKIVEFIERREKNADKKCKAKSSRTNR